MKYRILNKKELTKDLFSAFIRRQDVTKCWRKISGEWEIKYIPFIDDWNESEYEELICGLLTTLESGGFVAGAFYKGALKGFVSVESGIFGGENRYADLSNIHVSRDFRGNGIGRILFGMAKEWAAAHGAKKLYISAHSAVESQAFYHAMGCVEATEYNQAHVIKEPCDCQMECRIYSKP